MLAHTHARAANIHTTHKRGARANKSTDGGQVPIGTFVYPFVCGVNVGGTRVCVG